MSVFSFSRSLENNLPNAPCIYIYIYIYTKERLYRFYYKDAPQRLSIEEKAKRELHKNATTHI